MECGISNVRDANVLTAGSVAVPPAFPEWPFHVVFAWGFRGVAVPMAGDTLLCCVGSGTSTLKTASPSVTRFSGRLAVE